MAKNLISGKKFDFWQKIWFLARKFKFWQKNLISRKKIWFLEIFFYFWLNVLISGKKIDFWQNILISSKKILFLAKNFDFWQKYFWPQFQFLSKLSIFDHISIYVIFFKRNFDHKFDLIKILISKIFKSFLTKVFWIVVTGVTRNWSPTAVRWRGWWRWWWWRCFGARFENSFRRFHFDLPKQFDEIIPTLK